MFMILGVLLLVAVLGGMLFGYTQVAGRLLRREREIQELRQRMERVELAIDAIANQVERIRDRTEPGPRGLLPDTTDR